MELQHDRSIVISVGNSRKDIQWKAQNTTYGELYERLRSPQRGVETLADYLSLKKVDQDNLKDVGGFVGGSLSGGRRKATNVIGRDVITLDLDAIPPFQTQAVVDKVRSCGSGFCIYSTRKHMPQAPRLRVLFPMNRTAGPEEYEAVARYLANVVGITMADPSTFEPSRLMYWPSACSDGEYVFEYADAPMVDVDTVLSKYTNWRDWTRWPKVPGSDPYQRMAAKQGDPFDKPGVVGAFNRAYPSIMDAIDTFLSGMYTPVDTDPNRLTFVAGSTTGGAILYDGGKFIYSHHATDPAGGKLCNAFDLVRYHKFADQDDAVPAGTPTNRLPSFNAMCEFAVADDKVAKLLAKEKHDKAVADFMSLTGGATGPLAGSTGSGPTPDGTAGSGDADIDWMARLELNKKTGDVKPTIDNILIILDNDPNLKGKFALNEFASRGEVLGKLPWSTDANKRLWSDTDSDGLYWYMEKMYNLSGRGNIDSALNVHAMIHAFNPVKDYLDGLKWDGTPRLDTLFVEYLGAEDTPYTRAVTRKTFTAAVSRAVAPGCKFDQMLILCGAQGLGKSTIIAKMSKGWVNDSIRTFEGKDASELLQGVWLIEVPELDAFRRSDVSRIKQFLSLQADRYRAAYGRNTSEFPRRCVFFGTCNEMEFLVDTTGNRRFWAVDLGDGSAATRSVFTDLTDDVIDQVWAEAKVRWMAGEALFLSGELEEAAKKVQEFHRDVDPTEGLVHEFVARKVPVGWDRWELDKRRAFWSGLINTDDLELVDRQRVCAMEVLCELFGRTKADLLHDRSASRQINSILSATKEWERSENITFCGDAYGNQRGFKRRLTAQDS